MILELNASSQNRHQLCPHSTSAERIVLGFCGRAFEESLPSQPACVIEHESLGAHIQVWVLSRAYLGSVRTQSFAVSSRLIAYKVLVHVASNRYDIRVASSMAA